jgi:hypothetical protein
MELQLIEKLLHKYFEGETSTTEEKELKIYFSSPGVAQHLEQYRPLFGYFMQQETQHFNKPLVLKHNRKYTTWISVAASVVVMTGLFTFLNKEPEPENLGTFNDPEIAFKETQKALNMLSKNVNVGVKSVNYLEEYEQTRKTIFKQ